MELNYNRDLLKSLLSMVGTHDKECYDLKVSSVVIFNSKYHAEKNQELLTTDPKYSELSDASFTIEAEDDDIRAKFENIKRAIKQNIKSDE